MTTIGQDSQRLAAAIADALAAAEADPADRLAQVLPPSQAWTFAVLLATWHAAQNPQSRPAVLAATRGTTLPALWDALRPLRSELSPVVLAALDPREGKASAGLHLRRAAERSFVSLAAILRSADFRRAQRFAARYPKE